jgi:hypothetical protein
MVLGFSTKSHTAFSASLNEFVSSSAQELVLSWGMFTLEMLVGMEVSWEGFALRFFDLGFVLGFLSGEPGRITGELNGGSIQNWSCWDVDWVRDGMVGRLVFEVAMKGIGDAFLALVRAQNRAAGGTNRSQKLYRYI